MLGIMVESYEHVIIPLGFVFLIFDFHFFTKLRLFFNSLNGKFDLVIKVGLLIF